MARTKAFEPNDVLQKALELFWKKGYHATSVQDLVDHLGINRASIYSTFGDKRALFDQAFKLYRTTNTQALSRFLQSHSSIRDGLRNMFAIALNEADHRGCFVVNTTTELLPGDDEIAAVIRLNREDFIILFSESLKRGVDNGEFHKDLDIHNTASLLYTLYNGIKVIEKSGVHPQEQLDTLEVVLSRL
jgi:TetR/AcrR family transcriptional repressor of nem operon